MRRFDALVLDFDGVLVQSVDVKTRAFAELYAGHGPRVVSDVVAYHLAHGGISRFEKFRYFHRVFLGQALDPEEEAALGLRFSALVEDAVVNAPWVAGAREFLDRYHRRLALFVASGTPEEELQRIIARRNATRYFAGVGGAPRRKGEIIADFVDRGRFRRERVLMVGDASTDFEGAQEARVSFLGIGVNPRVFAGAVTLLPDLTGLEAFLTSRVAP